MNKLKCGHEDTVSHLMMGLATTLVAEMLGDRMIFPPAFEALKDVLVEEFDSILKDHGIDTIEVLPNYADQKYADPKTARPVLDAIQDKTRYYIEKMIAEGKATVVPGDIAEPPSKKTIFH